MASDESTTKSTREVADQYLREEHGMSVDDIEDAEATAPGLQVVIDGQPWFTPSDYSAYDAAHAVAGALLGGADEVTVERVGESDGKDWGLSMSNSPGGDR